MSVAVEIRQEYIMVLSLIDLFLTPNGNLKSLVVSRFGEFWFSFFGEDETLSPQIGPIGTFMLNAFSMFVFNSFDQF